MYILDTFCVQSTMESTLARLLNISTADSDNEKLRKLLADYFNNTDESDAEATDIESEIESDSEEENDNIEA